MFVSWKKLCKIAQEEAEAWREIAAGKNERIEELLEQIKDLYEKRADMYNFCCELKRDKDELLTRVEELETELQGARRGIQEWTEEFDELDNAYGRLETDYDRLHEERAFYEERCRYLEGEIEDKEELKAKLDLAIKQRDYYYDLLESTSDAYEEDGIMGREVK